MKRIALVFTFALFALPVLAGQNTLLWADASDNETAFNIERKVGACTAISSFSEIATVGANVTTYVDLAVTEGVTYCYRVRASGPGGTFSAYSNTADRLVPFTAPAAPTGLTVGP
jgi:hypothetical protein